MMDKSAILQELQNRGVDPTDTSTIPSPSNIPADQDSILAELKARGIDPTQSSPNVWLSPTNDSPPAAQPSTPPLSQSGFIPDLSAAGQSLAQIPDNLRARGAHLADIWNRASQGSDTVPATAGRAALGLYNTFGTEMGAGGDVAGGVLKAGYNAMPDLPFLSDNVKKDYNVAANSPVGRAVGSGIQSVKNAYGNFAAQNPNLSDFLDATGNIIGNAPILGATGELTSGIGGAVKTGLEESAIKPVTLSAKELTAISKDSYDAADKAGGVLVPQVRTSFINQLKDALPGEEDIKPGASVIQGILDKAKKNAGYTKDKEGNWEAPEKEKPLTLSAAETIDKGLTDVINGEYNTKGKITNEGRQLQDIQNNFRNAMYGATPDMIQGDTSGFQAYQQGVKQYAASRRMGDIENIFKRADTMDNPATSIKAGFRNIYLSGMRGYTPEQQAIIQKAANSNKFADYLRTTAGSRLISTTIGTISGAGLGALGAAAGAAAGAGIGEVSRGLATNAAKKRVSGLMQSISNQAVDNGTPLGTLYKYLGKDGGDAAMQSLQQGQVPQAISKLPVAQRQAIINSVSPADLTNLINQLGGK